MKSNQKSKFRPVINETPPSSDAIHGRGASWSPANRFEKLHVDLRDIDVVQIRSQRWRNDRAARRNYFRDSTKTIITHNNSPDVGFETSLNPYRGCEHGCIYCYARPTHEYLGFSAGLDFESRIMVKTDAPQLLEAELSSPKWKPQTLVMSGVTDPYQPVERRLRNHARLPAKCWRNFAIRLGSSRRTDLVTRDIDLVRRAGRASTPRR